ncbi:putative quinate permease [Termitomyces sp. T112]|nr:putative quinate permease [Termitomyces sp. T112]
MSAPPWEQWNLDAKFLEELSRWEDNNPQSRVDKVLDKLCSAIERGKEFFGLIPDGRFPARGLVMALANLVLLGKEITSADREIFLFTNEVVQWNKRIQQEFAADKKKWIGRSSTRQTWKNLQEMRDIIDDICRWAAICLSDSNRPFWEKLKTSKAIETFKNRMTEARKVFHDLETVKQSQAMDNILDSLRIMHKDQKEIFHIICHMISEQRCQQNEILARMDGTKVVREHRPWIVQAKPTTHVLTTWSRGKQRASQAEAWWASQAEAWWESSGQLTRGRGRGQLNERQRQRATNEKQRQKATNKRQRQRATNKRQR